MMNHAPKISPRGWVKVDGRMVGRVLDVKPRSLRWQATDLAGRTTHHTSRAKAAQALADRRITR